MTFTLSVRKADYKSFDIKCSGIKKGSINAKLDTCAQSCLWSLKDCLSFGFQTEDFIPVKFCISAAHKSRIEIAGAVIVYLEAITSKGKNISCSSMVYVSPAADGFFLSLEAMLDMGLIRPESEFFPNELRNKQLPQHTGKEDHQTCDQYAHFNICSCPPRCNAPPRPKSLPFPATADNNGRMKTRLLKRYSSSTFNICPHQQLPSMEGPPIEVHIDRSAKPRACHTPASIPLHWQELVHKDLLRDETLGVIEKVPYGQPVDWCHRMVITRKHDGSPRRTVDLSPLNKHCKRETFSSESPFQVARRIPKGTWKTVIDAWNGFHGIKLRECDRPLTTFISPHGRWRYIRAPQCYVSSGDGFNRRLDEVLADFKDKERCIDDICHYDQDLEKHWWRAIELLAVLGNAGVIINPTKFQFCEKTIDFAVFRISDSEIEPLPKYLDAIRHFPTPKNISDIRSWFGLVNQVSNYGQLRGIMKPFK